MLHSIAEPGQFVIVKIDEQGRRIPLTICDYNREAGTITIVFQTVGASTQRMVSLEQGERSQISWDRLDVLLI